MFTALEFENYMSFKHLEFNIQKKNKAKKIVAIYGENGSGKSNIVSAFMNLNFSIRTLRNLNLITNAKEILNSDEPDADKDKDFNRKLDIMMKVFRNERYSKLSSIFSRAYMLETEEPMKIKYEFQINGHNGYYELVFKKNNGEVYLASEKLNFLINKARGNLFEISSNNNGKIDVNFSPNLFKNKDAKTIMNNSIARFWGKHTFLSIFDDFEDSTNSNYVQDNVSKNLRIVINNFKSISFRADDASGTVQLRKMLHNLANGSISKDEDSKIDITEKALKNYFIPLYSDIEDIFYERNNSQENKIEYRLFEKKRMNNELITIPFEMESNGTKKLLELFPLFLNVIAGQTVIIDEIDQGIHDLLIERIIDNIKEDIEGQLIFTTHDTQIMQQLDVGSLYVLQVESDGSKRIVNLSNASQKQLGTNNNIQKLYLNGYFSGIPYADDVDFYDILENMGENE
ncbi:ATP/GTP-binding protein [Latilactobacillus sakei]|uniref:AAA family ATPase n=1 Tax=Latilactobacillus sakei TaxID=1599 RepID=UPI003889DB5F